MTDIHVDRHGADVVLVVVSDKGKAWLAQHVSKGRWSGSVLATDPHDALEIIEDAREAGLEVE